ncbi:hypothetical protein MYIN104542_17400 [Mycobacterium intermedium]
MGQASELAFRATAFAAELPAVTDVVITGGGPQAGSESRTTGERQCGCRVSDHVRGGSARRRRRRHGGADASGRVHGAAASSAAPDADEIALLRGELARWFSVSCLLRPLLGIDLALILLGHVLDGLELRLGEIVANLASPRGGVDSGLRLTLEMRNHLCGK